MPTKLSLEKDQARMKSKAPSLHPCPGKQTAAKATREDGRDFSTVTLHVEKPKERSKDPQRAFPTAANTLQAVSGSGAIHLTGFCRSRSAPRSLARHSEACWITLQAALSYFCAIKIEFNLNIHPLKVTAILSKVKKYRWTFLKAFLNALTLLAEVSEQCGISTSCSRAEDYVQDPI